MSKKPVKPAEAEGMIMTPMKGFRPLTTRGGTMNPFKKVGDAMDKAGKPPAEKPKK